MKQRNFYLTPADNALLVTEQCNNCCMMCCQPPKRTDDIEALFARNVRRIKATSADLPVVCITGGEPALLGERLVDLIRIIREELPDTDIHVLSNGRNFKDMYYARMVAEAGEGRILFGIPLHSDYEADHDMIAGAKGAYNDTMLGLYNIAMLGGCIELRVVMTRLNFRRFLPMAEFIHKNLSFVSWTAFMGMERTGYAEKRGERIWIEPREYIPQLGEAVRFLDSWRHDVAIYNIPLCLLSDDLRAFAKRSISAWKNYYPPLCDGCTLKSKCCGLFATSGKEYEGLKCIG